MDKIAHQIQTNLQKERTDLQNFEKSYYKRHGEIVEELRRAEKETKKSGKKSPYQLQQAIQELTDKMNEMTNHRQAKLKEILLMERKRYCDIVHLLNSVIDSQMSLSTYSNQTLQDQHQKWKGVADTYNQLPSDCQALISRSGVKERTSTAITTGELSSETVATESYDEYASEAYYDENYYNEGDEYYEGYEEGYDEGYEEGYEEEEEEEGY